MKSKIIIIASTVLAILTAVGIIVGITACKNNDTPAQTVSTSASPATSPEDGQTEPAEDTQTEEGFNAGRAADEILDYFSVSPHVGETIEEFAQRNPYLADAELDEYGVFELDESNFESKGYTVKGYEVFYANNRLANPVFESDKSVITSDYSGFSATLHLVSYNRDEIIDALKERFAVEYSGYELEEKHDNRENWVYIVKGDQKRKVLWWKDSNSKLDVIKQFDFGSEEWNKDNTPLLFKGRTLEEMSEAIISFLEVKPQFGEKVSEFVRRLPVDVDRVFAITYDVDGEKWIDSYDYYSVETLMSGEKVFSSKEDSMYRVVYAIVIDFDDASELFDLMSAYYAGLVGENNLRIYKDNDIWSASDDGSLSVYGTVGFSMQRRSYNEGYEFVFSIR